MRICAGFVDGTGCGVGTGCGGELGELVREIVVIGGVCGGIGSVLFF